MTSGVIWTDAEGNVLSENSLLSITLKPGPNVMSCKYKVEGWSGTKTLTMDVEENAGEKFKNILRRPYSDEISLFMSRSSVFKAFYAVKTTFDETV